MTAKKRIYKHDLKEDHFVTATFQFTSYVREHQNLFISILAVVVIVAITRWVTYHGLALNVATDLDAFGLIVPCGIRDRGVTSLSRLLGRNVAPDEVAPALVEEFARVFGFAAVTETAANDV